MQSVWESLVGQSGAVPQTSDVRAKMLAIRMNLLVCTICQCIAQSMTLSALLSTDWIQYTAPGATEPSEISTPEQTMILVILALLLGISGLFAMLLRFFKRHPRRTIIVALVFVILGALCIILAVSTAELFAIQVIPDGATDVVAGFGAVSLFISCPLATVSAVMLAIDYKFGKSNEYIPEKERRLSLSITLIALYLAIGSYIFAKSWNYGDSVVFCVATISTIGYGNIVPVTTGGRIFCIFYAIIGILLVGYTIDTLRQMIIEIIVDSVDVIYRATHKRSREEKLQDARERHKHVRLAKQSVIAFAIVVLWIGGAALFYFTERDHGWSYFDALWFCFATLTTIGYGDFYPSSRASELLFPYYTFVSLGVFAFILTAIGEETRRSMEDRFLHGSKKKRNSKKQKEGESGLNEPLLKSDNHDGAEEEDDDDDDEHEHERPVNDEQLLDSIMLAAESALTGGDHVPSSTIEEAISGGSSDDAAMDDYLRKCRALLNSLRRQNINSDA